MIAANVSDYREAARRRLPRVLFDYIDGGSYAETTAAANVDDIQRMKLRQRVLRDVSKLSMETEVFGQKLSMPVALSPVGLAGMYARRGEVQAAKAAKAHGVPFSLSTMGVCTMEEVAAGAGTPPWYQLYMIRDRGFMAEVLARAKAVGCPVLLFTVDLPFAGSRYRDTRNQMLASSFAAQIHRAVDGLMHPEWLWDVQINGAPHSLGNVAHANSNLKDLAQFWAWIGRNFDPSVTWKDLDWVRAHWDGPIVIKGVLDVADARDAVSAGVEGLIVSNHGGRQLDGAPSSIAALPAIAQAVGDKLTVMMDGGVRSGLDVLKAMSQGAKAVMIGRAWAYALGGGSQAGVEHMLAVMRAELRLAMGLTGCTDVREAGGDLIAG